MEQSLYQLTKDSITIILTIWGLIIASLGLFTWKKQIKGGKEFEVGFNLNLSVLKLRNAIKYVRNPAIWPSESYNAEQYSRTKYPHLSDKELEKNSHAYVYEMRWEKITEAFTNVESHLLAAEVLWGSKILNLIKPLEEKVKELNIALQQKFETKENRAKKTIEIFEIIYDKGDGSENEDKFSNAINDAVNNISSYIKTKY